MDNPNAFKTTIVNKIIHLQEIVCNVIRANQLYKLLGVLEATDLNACIIFAEHIFHNLKTHLQTVQNLPEDVNVNNAVNDSALNDTVVNTLQDIIYEISSLINIYGCDTIDSLINICIGNKYVIDQKYKEKYKLLNSYVRPTHYKIVDWKKTSLVKSNDEYISKNADNFECFTLDNPNLLFQNTIFGIKVAVHDMSKQHTIIVYGIIDDIDLGFIDNTEIKDKLQNLSDNKPDSSVFNITSYERFIKCLTLKDVLVFSNTELKERYILFITNFQNNIIKKPLLQVINEFTEKELVEKRNTLIMILVNSNENDCHYLAYLLYDLLSNDNQGIIDTYEQILIYNSLPCNVKKYFRDAMKHIISYTNKLSKVDINKLSLEQRICLMKTDDLVKEKAMVKYKEIKMKSEDTCSKAMQFLEGLLKIPFGIYKEEPILRVMREIISLFSTTLGRINQTNFYFNNGILIPFPQKPNYTGIEIRKYFPLLKTTYKTQLYANILARCKVIITGITKNKIIGIYELIKSILAKHQTTQVKYTLINYTGKSVAELRSNLLTTMEELLLIEGLSDIILNECILNENILQVGNDSIQIANEFGKNLQMIETSLTNINTYMANVSETLDSSVYGHAKAKRQIERIIGQWINGDVSGYCFGFEGPPGVGKTSLAKKGISCCLKDGEGNSRPFSFIAMGGSTNSSTLDGHNYTYVGSTWGRIVDILMDTKIMNPIIFIDELDKVSKTENGKEIIGILTHLIDQTQNDAFQDKYFNGINLNISKALFIFSYNDAELIDRILLDRIHRIKFDHLSVEDKLIITRKFILPEIYKKMGLLDMIEINDTVIEFIINSYTCESGVRKLKELMFEIVGEINLAVLKNDEDLSSNLPIIITEDDIKHKYLKDRHEIRAMNVHLKSSIGVINGLWANSLGRGGVLPIESSFYPSNNFLELKLTGMQGNVMKESMEVAKSLAWSLFMRDVEECAEFKKKIEENKYQGIHIHVPEGATPKDGPSAGTAITMVMYSLFSGKKIKNEVAITGEICLQGRVTAIGGLDLKILGGIRAGVKLFIFPKENQKDFADYMEKYGKKELITDVKFIMVETIDEVIPLIFE